MSSRKDSSVTYSSVLLGSDSSLNTASCEVCTTSSIMVLALMGIISWIAWERGGREREGGREGERGEGDERGGERRERERR